MAVTNKDFLDAANNIFQNAKSEIDFRNSISRAYYAGYHEGENLFKKGLVSYPSMGFFSSKNTGVHQKMINALKNSADVNIKKIGNLLQTCKNERNRADYHLSMLVDKSRAQVVIGLINQVLKIANNFP